MLPCCGRVTVGANLALTGRNFVENPKIAKMHQHSTSGLWLARDVNGSPPSPQPLGATTVRPGIGIVTAQQHSFSPQIYQIFASITDSPSTMGSCTRHRQSTTTCGACWKAAAATVLTAPWLNTGLTSRAHSGRSADRATTKKFGTVTNCNFTPSSPPKKRDNPPARVPSRPTYGSPPSLNVVDEGCRGRCRPSGMPTHA